MPIQLKMLDSSVAEEDITIILGRNILLKIIKDSKKQSLLNDELVKKFVAIPNLCHKEMRSLIEELFEKEDSILSPMIVKDLQRLTYKDFDSIKKFQLAFKPLVDFTTEFSKALEKEITPTLKRMFITKKDELTPIMSNLIYAMLGKPSEEMEARIGKLQSISNKIEEKTGLEMLVPYNLLFCPKCEVVLSKGEYMGTKECYICKKKIARKDAKRIDIYKVHDKIREVWQNNLWFEAYLARLLRRLGYKTWTGIHVMGASGILHEIDVLAIRDGTVLIGECKVGKVSRNDVFNFCTKANDLKTHISILALLKELPDPETREFVRKNPAIIRIENMGKRKENRILNELKKPLSIKA